MTTRAQLDDILAEIEKAAAKLSGPTADSPTKGRRTRDRISGLEPEPEIPEPAGSSPARNVFFVGEFLIPDDETFIDNAYRAVLGRPADRGGRETLLSALENGSISRVGVLVNLTMADEAKGREIAISGLKAAHILERAGRAPVVGRLIAPFVLMARLPGLLKALERRVSALDRRQRAVRDDLKALAARTRQSLHDVDATFDEVDEAIQDVEASHERLKGWFSDEHAEMMRRLEKVRTDADHAIAEAKAVHHRTLDEARTLRALVDGVKGRADGAQPVSHALAAIDDHGLDDLYLAFENRFRGSEEEISRRFERYLPLVAACEPATRSAPILDIGCGRGEWLTLLSERGYAGRGIDLNKAMVRAALERGHDVIEGDAIAFLNSLPEASLSGVTGFQLVEHLPFRQLIALLDATRHALQPGGFVLFETPNPESLVVGACNFHYDPTHIRPLPPELMRFLAQERGLVDTRVIRFDSDCDLAREPSRFEPQDVNSWFQMPMDYALFARRR